jgi:hypothetical protein
MSDATECTIELFVGDNGMKANLAIIAHKIYNM